MGRGSRAGKDHAPRRPIDLTGIISIAERNDLVTLVNAITERMHLNISNIFDSPPVTPIDDEDGHHHWLSLALFHSKENKPPSSTSQTKIKGETSKSYKKAHDIIENEEAQSMTPQLRELKKEALIYFRKWQTTVNQRIRDISVNDVNFSQGSPRSSSRGRGRGMRGGSRGRGGRGGCGGRGGLTLATGPPRVPPTHIDPSLASRYPPIPNALWSLHIEKRKRLLHIMLLLVLSMQDFNANARILLVNLASSLNIPLKTYHRDEIRVAQGLAKAALELIPEDEVILQAEEEKTSRKLKSHWLPANGGPSDTSLAASLTAVGIGTAQSGLGLTSSTAAALLGTMAENGVIMGSLFGISATRPTSRMNDSLCREIQDFSFVSLQSDIPSDYRDAKETPAENRRLRLVIAMNGFLTKSEDIKKSWKCLGNQAEIYTVRWETTTLSNLGNSLETVIKSTSWNNAKKEIRARTIFSSLIDAVWPIPLLKISKIMDNPWSVGMVRAEKAGAVLADAIMRHKFQGDRSVSLIGFSLAARSIYTCLMVLAERRQFGLVDSVVLMGLPAPSESRVWLTLKSVVSGRLVNVYSEHDYILGFLYRTSNTHFGLAGLQEIQGADGVENYRVPNLVNGHLGYQSLTGQILKDIGWEDLDQNVIRAEKGIGKRAAK